jgi:ribosylpyrimidine nucleosidase
MEHIILDCDPGHDDAVAILLAGNSPLIDLIAISVSAGNQTIEKTTINALNVCQYLKIDAPVYAGAKIPLIRKQEVCEAIHGASGLDGVTFPPLTRKVEKEHAVDFLVETLRKAKEPITIVSTGPLTNIALALRLDPSIEKNIAKFVIMGGSYQMGNVSPAAEFNILTDPEACYIVMNTNVPKYMVTLDVTRKVLC